VTITRFSSAITDLIPHTRIEFKLSQRTSVILLCVFQAFALLGTLGICGFAYLNRWTFFRRVYDAQQNGQDAYQASRDCADVLAFEFMWPITTCVVVCSITSVAVIVLTLTGGNKLKDA